MPRFWWLWDVRGRPLLVLALMGLTNGLLAVSSVVGSASAVAPIVSFEDPVPDAGSSEQPSPDYGSKWDPCEQVEVRLVGESAAETEFVTEALARIATATTLDVALTGSSDGLPARPSLGITIDFVSSDHPIFDGVDDVAGIAVVRILAGNIVAASVAVVNDIDLTPGFGPGVTEGNVLLHELAHAVGLGHNQDPGSIMFPTTSLDHPDGFGEHDIQALTNAGTPGCAAG